MHRSRRHVRGRRLALLGLLLLVATPAQAQDPRVELQGWAGWTLSDGVSGDTVVVPDVGSFNRIDPKDSVSWGLRLVSSLLLGWFWASFWPGMLDPLFVGLHALEGARMSSKVLKKLARAGVVTSQRGAKGGYALARAPERIGVNEVIEAIEGPIAVTEQPVDSATVVFSGSQVGNSVTVQITDGNRDRLVGHREVADPGKIGGQGHKTKAEAKRSIAMPEIAAHFGRGSVAIAFGVSSMTADISACPCASGCRSWRCCA